MKTRPALTEAEIEEKVAEACTPCESFADPHGSAHRGRRAAQTGLIEPCVPKIRAQLPLNPT